jgi:hypothetical protein
MHALISAVKALLDNKKTQVSPLMSSETAEQKRVDVQLLRRAAKAEFIMEMEPLPNGSRRTTTAADLRRAGWRDEE